MKLEQIAKHRLRNLDPPRLHLRALTGWRSPVTQLGLAEKPSYGPVGVIITQDFPDVQHATDILQRGTETHPGMFFVIRSTDRYTKATLEEAGLGQRLLLAPLNPHWKGAVDNRRQMRDYDMRRFCSLVLIFRTKGSRSTDSWLPKEWWQRPDVWGDVRVIERGQKKTSKQTRNLVGKRGQSG